MVATGFEEGELLLFSAMHRAGFQVVAASKPWQGGILAVGSRIPAEVSAVDF